MDDQTKQLLESLQSNPAAIQTLFRSQDGQQLLRMLTQADRGAALQHAALSASQGNTSEMVQLMGRVMHSPEGAELVERIGKAIRK